MKGDEIIQLYIHQRSGHTVVRPVKELKGFHRISLAAGETKTITFSITNDMLKHWTSAMKFEAEPGEYEIMVGPNSTDFQKISLNIQ
jgi:beta-glucosidase